MLKVVKRVNLKRATDPEHGNVQTFLERLLVEVIVHGKPWREETEDHRWRIWGHASPTWP